MLDFLILSLATWRISNLLVDEDGPYHILSSFRYKIGIDFTERGERFSTNEFAELFSCVHCLSIWLGILIAIAYFFIPVYVYWLCLPFALSAVACMVSKWMQ